MGDDDALGRGLDFLSRRQLAGGRFELWFGEDLAAGDPAPDPSVFATAHIAHSVSICAEPRATAILEKALAFLRSEMEPPGVWRHWTRDHPQYRALPADADDTAVISALLRRHGVDVPDIGDLLAANRDPSGRFYTWFVAHRRRPPRHPQLWRLALRHRSAPLRSWGFWRATQAGRDDVDCVVNANVLLLLGDSPATAPAADWLAEVARSGTEATCDRWYRGGISFAYAVARCLRHGVRSLDPLRDPLRERVRARLGGAGAVGGSALETALAACTLDELGGCDAEVLEACRFLASAQAADGGWPIAPFYFGGSEGAFSFGSRELTTGFCVEALARRASAP